MGKRGGKVRFSGILKKIFRWCHPFWMHLPSIRQNLIKMERTERIAQLISARMLGQELTEEEKRELDDWLGEEQANKDLLEEVRSLRGVRQFVQLEQEGYGEQMAAAFAERCRGGKRRSLRRIVLAAVGSAAAVVCAGGGTLDVDGRGREVFAGGGCGSGGFAVDTKSGNGVDFGKR